MFKTYNKEKIDESVKILNDLAGTWGCRSIFWIIAASFSILKLGNAMAAYGLAAGRRDAIRVIMDDLVETESEDN